jgi:hypothetical protein
VYLQSTVSLLPNDSGEEDRETERGTTQPTIILLALLSRRVGVSLYDMLS